VDADSLNSPRWPGAPKGGFHEAWFVSASDGRAGHGLWLRYAVEMSRAGAVEASVSASWFEQGERDHTFVIRKSVAPATISRGAVRFGDAELTAAGCAGAAEAGGHALRWRFTFGQGDSADEMVPAWMAPIARLRGSGYVLPHSATTISGAVEVDGRTFEVQRVPAAQGHLWGRSYWPAWAWARCSAFAEDADASIDLLDVEGPLGARLPMFALRFRGAVHRFGELPWMPLTVSQAAPPSWHFAARDARVAIDGVVRSAPETMVQVQYANPDGSFRHCVHSAVASMEVRVRSRAFVGAPWRAEGTLTSKSGASLEFCGRAGDPRVSRLLVPATPLPANRTADGSVAS
jgi:hypothetical protein